MTEPSVKAVGIVVADLEVSLAFYARVGLEFIADPAVPGHAVCDLPGGMRLTLSTEDLVASYLPRWTPPAGDPRVFLAIEFPTRLEVNAKYAELTEAGYRGLREPGNALWGMRYATVLDPDGNGVDLYSPIPIDEPSGAGPG